MLYAIISDIHANEEALRAVIDDSKVLAVDRIVSLGDIVGFNERPNECVDILRDLGVPSVMGNHDAIACDLQEPWGFNPRALEAVNKTKEALSAPNIKWLLSLPDVLPYEHFLAVHGSPTNRNTYLFTWEDVEPHFACLDQSDHRVCFFGHTHSPRVYSLNGPIDVRAGEVFELERHAQYFINPGSVGQSRDDDERPAYGLYDTVRQTYQLIRLDGTMARLI